MKGRGQHVNPLSVELCIEHQDRLADLILFLHAHRDSFASVQHRSMIPTPEGFSNFMQAGFGVTPSQIRRWDFSSTDARDDQPKLKELLWVGLDPCITYSTQKTSGALVGGPHLGKLLSLKLKLDRGGYSCSGIFAL
jgi:hypothetical protein